MLRKGLEEEADDVNNLSIEDYEKYKKDGFVDLPNGYINSIAAKLIKNDNDVNKLSTFEKEIYNSDIKGAIDMAVTAMAAENK